MGLRFAIIKPGGSPLTKTLEGNSSCRHLGRSWITGPTMLINRGYSRERRSSNFSAIGQSELRAPRTPGIFTKVSYGDIDFFLLDNRYHRDHDTAPDHAEKSMFGKSQLMWLKNALLTSTATFKIVTGGSQFLDNQQHPEGWQHFPHERERFLEWLRTAKPPGVMFLSGDRHLTKLIRYDHHVPYPLYELTCSPLTSGPADPSKENPNQWVVPGTMIGERNFCALTFEGKKSDRKLSIGVYTTQGSKLWDRSIYQSDLKEHSKEKPDGEK